MPDPYYIQASTYVQKMSMYNLRCAAEENCLARYWLGSPRPGCPISLQALLLCLVLTTRVPCRQELGNGARAGKWNVVSCARGPGWRVNILKISLGSAFQTVTQIREIGSKPLSWRAGISRSFSKILKLWSLWFPITFY